MERVYIGRSTGLLMWSPQYGVSVSESSPEIRNAFVRKVYSILCEYQLMFRLRLRMLNDETNYIVCQIVSSWRLMEKYTSNPFSMSSSPPASLEDSRLSQNRLFFGFKLSKHT